MGDLDKLDAILDWCDAHPEEAERRKLPEREFRDMRRTSARWALSDRQCRWIRSVHAIVFDEPEYENLVSSGKAPRGREVPTPAVLQNLPKKPPSRPGGDAA